MAAIYNIQQQVFIRLFVMYSLIFFVCTLLNSCKHNKHDKITINWKNDKAVEMVIPLVLLNKQPVDCLQVRVENAGNLSMLGSFDMQDDDVIFRPVISFTRGLNYNVFTGSKKIGKINIPLNTAAQQPVIISTYPTTDTLPENLLKIYLCFSKPMREGQSQKFISLLDQKSDTLEDVFLDLQPELWNEERTVLTIWLDPGRIKRDLIPNLQKGNPLKTGMQYTLVIAGEWSDQEGLALSQPYTRTFLVGGRDSTGPDIEKWRLKPPIKNTRQPLRIYLNEALDYYLLQETIKVKTDGGNIIPGNISIGNKERTYQFIPDNNWLPGSYHLQVAAQLEDLAGNNLNRPFDRDTKAITQKQDKPFYQRSFEISSSGLQ